MIQVAKEVRHVCRRTWSTIRLLSRQSNIRLTDFMRPFKVNFTGLCLTPAPADSAFSNDNFSTGYAPLLVLLGLLYSVSSILRSIVLEKEFRQKELMKMMSVTESDIGWSWFTSYFVFHIITSIACAAASASLYDSSSFVILLAFWILSFIFNYHILFCDISCIFQSNNCNSCGIIDLSLLVIF